MSHAQTRLYFRTWAQVRRLLVDLGGFTPAEAEAERHAIHREALGTDKSSRSLTNRDLDLVLAAFEARLVLLTGPGQPDRAAEQPRRRLLFAIDRLGLGDPYLNRLAHDQFHAGDWRSLGLADLTRLRFTATARARSRRRPPSDARS